MKKRSFRILRDIVGRFFFRVESALHADVLKISLNEPVNSNNICSCCVGSSRIVKACRDLENEIILMFTIFGIGVSVVFDVQNVQCRNVTDKTPIFGASIEQD